MERLLPRRDRCDSRAYCAPTRSTSRTSMASSPTSCASTTGGCAKPARSRHARCRSISCEVAVTPRVSTTLAGDPEIGRGSRRSPRRIAARALRRGARGSLPAVRDGATLVDAPLGESAPGRAATRSRRSRAPRVAATWSEFTRPAAIYCGFANSLGQRNWYANGSFNLDWSFVHSADKAVATNYAGFEWSHAAFDRKVESALAELELAARPPRTVPPGRYRVYLAPAALADFLGLLSWGGFGLRAHRSKTTPLLAHARRCAAPSSASLPGRELARRLSRLTSRRKASDRPDQVSLIDGGAYRDCLASPRSAAEYRRVRPTAPRERDAAVAGRRPGQHRRR